MTYAINFKFYLCKLTSFTISYLSKTTAVAGPLLYYDDIIRSLAEYALKSALYMAIKNPPVTTKYLTYV